jgi:acetyltransferase-like isoleucine patch superfamily enzyme
MLIKYGVFGLIKLFVSYAFTRLFYPKARLIRLPIDIRNEKYIYFGNRLTTGYGCRIEAHPIIPNLNKCLIFGKNIEINDYVHIAAGEKIIIGDNVLIASKVFISDIIHGNYIGENQTSPLTIPKNRKLASRPIIIEDNVWIGEFVSVLPGVTIGKGTIVGSNSVVSKSLPANVIAVGSPAKPIKMFNFDTQKWEKI